MGTLLGAYNQPKLNQKDISHLNTPVKYNEIKAVIRVSLQRRAKELMDSGPNFTKPLKKN
jgi:hypothetical protein